MKDSRFRNITRGAIGTLVVAFLLGGLLSHAVAAPAVKPSAHILTIAGKDILVDGKPSKLIGVRVSNSLISDEEAKELIDNLDVFRSYGVNTIAVYIMGSRFGNIKGYNPDASLNSTYQQRFERIIEEADKRAMIVLVGCLYWSTSEAKADLGHWTQKEANLAVANTVKWVTKRGYRHVFVDPDNEGMAHAEKGWSIKEMIDAGHAQNPACVMAYNSRQAPPANANIYIHHSPKVAGKPYVQTEGTPTVVPYWGSYSKKDGYLNYINIGVYTDAMKEQEKAVSAGLIDNANGYCIASTWLQAVPPLGPNMNPGGYGSEKDPGIKWWLEFIKARYGRGEANAVKPRI